ncbi:MAG TPA: alpha/beta hydrolase [Terriglobia bacterium]|nr:alpha/beta hydrolase [Terriglobia bacterium]
MGRHGRICRFGRGLYFATACVFLAPVILKGQSAEEASLPKVELLWPGGAPGALGNADTDRPTLTIYLPEHAQAAGFGVVVCPGGGYQNLAMDHEGKQVAEWLNGLGAAAFVLKYRLGPRYHHPVEMEDGLRAMRFVRFHAADYGIAPDRIGIWGFSAGGHLASTVGTHFDGGNPNAADAIERVGSRPDFMVLAYPVITFTTPYAHKGSMRNLLGDNPDAKLVHLLSNELQVTPETPPTFLFQTTNDETVPVENSVLFYEALLKNHVPAEMHIFERGHHGVGLAQNDPALSHWPELLAQWFRTRGLLK